MKFLKNNMNAFIAVTAMSALALQACNKEFETIAETPVQTTGTVATGSQSINDIINNDTTYSYFKALIARAGTSAPALGNTSLRFTAFIPKNAAFRAAGIPTAAVVTALPVAQAVGIANYAVTPQLLLVEQIPTTFPNLQAPTLLNPTAGTTGFNPLVSLSIFPSRRATAAWVNNIPLVATNIAASNGLIHNPAVLVAPPSTTLWSRISTDADMTYFKAAVSRGDSGMVGSARFDSLLNLPIGPNFTVFVPTNASMQALLTAQITGALVAQGVPLATAQTQATALASSPTVFSNPALYGALSAQTVKAIVVYHMLGSRAFTVNFPTTATATPTLLNSAIPTHPGVILQATFGTSGVTAATVKGAANTTASNLLINPATTSDQHFTNGVLHKIDQVLRPQ